MPRTPVDYTKTIIYKLVHKEDYDNANIYIGSTTDFIKRKYTHKNSYYNEKNKNYNEKKYQYIRENGGWDCFNMIEIEKYPCNDGNEAKTREEYWRCYFNATLNSYKAFILYTDTKKNYYEINKDIAILKQKEYRINNKEKINKKITCECGYILNNRCLNRHLKTQNHINLINASAFETH
jgi:hypothetical protein